MKNIFCKYLPKNIQSKLNISIITLEYKIVRSNNFNIYVY